MKHYQVKLSEDERNELHRMVSSGHEAVRTIRRARILPKSAQGWTDQAIGEALEVSQQTLHVVRKRCVEAGAAQTVRRQKPGRKVAKLVDGVTEAHLIAVTCSAPPACHYPNWPS